MLLERFRQEASDKELKFFPKEGADEAVQVRLRALATKYEFANDALREARTFLKDLPLQLKEPATQSLRDELTTMVREDPETAASVIRGWIGSTG